jgi:hypothetical protein
MPKLRKQKKETMNLVIAVQRNKEIMNLEIVDLKRSQQTQAVHQS